MERAFVVGALVVALLSWASLAPAEDPPPVEGKPTPSFSADQIDQMVAPIALYPDSLLAQILIASTYPLEIVEADRWRRQNASLKDAALDKALEQKDWDPSVEGLTHFPDLLKRMSDNLDWTKDLGDAFLEQKDDVMNAVQLMRRKAAEAGNLQTTPQQTVTKEVVNHKETIVIQPADPQVVYVPQYQPTVYGPTYAPPAAYYPAPAVYGYTGAQMATASLLSFGVGVGVGALISDGFGWGSNDVHVNNNYYGGGGGGGGGGKNNNSNNNININKGGNTINAGNRGSWQHNPEHRRNVDYRDKRTQERFDKRDPQMARDRQAREQARGYDRGNAGNRGDGAAGRPDRGGQQGARPDRGGQQGARPGGGGQQAARPGGGDRGRPNQTPGGGGRPESRPASPAGGGRQGALGGYGNGGETRQASQRGATSRGGQSYAGAGGGAQRGGGGGGRGGGGGGGGGGGRGGGGHGGGGGRKR